MLFYLLCEDVPTGFVVQGSFARVALALEARDLEEVLFNEEFVRLFNRVKDFNHPESLE